MRGMTVHARALLVALLFASTNAQAQSSEETYEKVVALGQDLILGTNQQKLDAAGALGKIRAIYSVPVLEKALSDPSPQVRMTVVVALGGIVHKSAVKALFAASSDADEDVAEAAIIALGDMHTQDAYDALMKLIGKVKSARLKNAVLDGVKKWNKPFVPLPDPVALPDGKTVPALPTPAPVIEPAIEGDATAEPGKPEVPGKDDKVEKVAPPTQVSPLAVDGAPGVEPSATPLKGLEPDVEAAFAVLDTVAQGVASCMQSHDLVPPYVPVKVTVSAGGGVSQVAVLRSLEPEMQSCVMGQLLPLEFPPAAKSYALEYEFQADSMTEAVPGEQPLQGPPSTSTAAFSWAVPSLMLEMQDLTSTSSVAFETVTAKLGAMPGRVTTMKLSGGWTGKWVGFGAVIPFSGATSLPPDVEGNRQESWVMGNMGLWARHVGKKDMGKLVLRWGFSMSFYLPTGSSIPFSAFEIPPSYQAGAGALMAGYGKSGAVYPNLEKTFKLAIAPCAGVALDLGPVSFQLELGVDAVVLGDAMDPDEERSSDVTDVSLLHMGLGTAVRPLSWLQVSLELVSVFEVGGRALGTHQYDSEVVGSPIGSEVFITPGLTVLVPVSDAGSAHLALGLRVPLGQIGGYNGSPGNTMQLEPILVLASGFRWGSSDQI